MREMKTEVALAATLRLSQPDVDPRGAASVALREQLPNEPSKAKLAQSGFLRATTDAGAEADAGSE